MLMGLFLILYCGECHVNMCEVKRGRVMLVVLLLILYCGECHVNMTHIYMTFTTIKNQEQNHQHDSTSFYLTYIYMTFTTIKNLM
jgi:hypothetical protein